MALGQNSAKDQTQKRGSENAAKNEQADCRGIHDGTSNFRKESSLARWGASIGPWANIEVIACRILQNGYPSGFDALGFVSSSREFPYKSGYQGYWTKVQ
jgi:hypothetical protein